ncbi:NUDIX hydrolase [Rhodococcus sp. BP-349]|uniref:NUDIX hydrolase n=1 Tax=unclassified Rhodococcus (in: high G+C Gram-positive bacteria) TaxID=192944 RepID=UPI001C9B2572|nr:MULTISPECIES: NUDIX hydrolase [unclassified Rhodococcus (in: high G+C Gram-positive bacteria)]MBY6540807.1 NUDIX hydrolase [Rhodococcus sp. BP-363]MBY6545167.1 NUDIX hydrolase [Rhodococcus sp. BP-369]MBY6564397.1 NUDIX hydrolase [Rhodococcus sp. BP-370]MBY6578666.1 NUDIX hydrolase [Rhodococcus sp. BP-364]MBY6587967.1 NUDIX hydrolase [Rhodococcus sp. BP-358]
MTEPVALRDASTVILLRDAPAGLEVFLQRRVGRMAFAAGMTVFPGGGVDPTDRTPADGEDRWAGPSPAWWAARFGTDDDAAARALVLAAVRETFEECGVLFAGPDAHTVVADTSDHADRRRAVEKHEISFGEFLAETRLVVRSDLLRPHARWITPEGETTRRYDTRFFVAALPSGQRPDGETSEAVDAAWVRPADALDEFRRGDRMLMPPTWACLRHLAGHGSVAEAMAAEADLAPVQPVISGSGGSVRVNFDGADEYRADLPPRAERTSNS